MEYFEVRRITYWYQKYITFILSTKILEKS